MPPENNAPALAAVAKAEALVTGGAAAPRERALIAALKTRYAPGEESARADLDAAYADAMFGVYQTFSDDADIATLHADAALNESRASGWWTANGRLPTPRNASALVALERALKAAPDHAGAIHYYIHAQDSGPRPERAEPFAEKLAGLMPGAGHMVHMPAHIYYRRGRYLDALAANFDALKTDDRYLAEANSADGVYRYQLYAHNLHFAMAAAGMAGDSTNALALARRLDALLAKNVIPRPDFYAAAALQTRVKFQSPAEILALPAPPNAAVYVRGLRLYARATAQVATGDLAAARTEIEALAKIRGETDLEAMLLSYGRTPQMLQLAEEVARGRVATAEKNWDAARAHFETAAGLQDAVRSFDPPAWDFPVRQAVGLTLLKAGRANEAIDVLRAALMDAPNNGIVLEALARASEATGDAAGAAQYRALLKKAWAGKAPPDVGKV